MSHSQLVFVARVSVAILGALLLAGMARADERDSKLVSGSACKPVRPVHNPDIRYREAGLVNTEDTYLHVVCPVPRDDTSRRARLDVRVSISNTSEDPGACTLRSRNRLGELLDSHTVSVPTGKHTLRLHLRMDSKNAFTELNCTLSKLSYLAGYRIDESPGTDYER